MAKTKTKTSTKTTPKASAKTAAKAVVSTPIVTTFTGISELGNKDDAEYAAYQRTLTARLVRAVCKDGLKLFQTNVTGLFDVYLSAFTSPSDRQYHNCHACRSFVNRFGGLVTIDEKGRTTPIFWSFDDVVPDDIADAVYAVYCAVRNATVTGPFLSSDKVWGQLTTGIWSHMAAVPPEEIVYKGKALTAGQVMAEKVEDYRNVQRALGEFDRKCLSCALSLLDSDTLYRSEKVLGPVKWLSDLVDAKANAHSLTQKKNVVWRAVASAPAGFCHPRSSMAGTLLEDLAAGMDFELVSKRFEAKMNPLRYQRPSAPPSDGAIEVAEKLVDKMGIRESLPRRFARLSDVQVFWKPSPSAHGKQDGSVFGHLRSDADADQPIKVDMPPVVMTWSKFFNTVLPSAKEIEIFTKFGSDSFSSLLTAVNPDAPPILQWDKEECRNPVSWYFWHGGSLPRQFGLVAGRFYKLSALALKPSMWNGNENPHQGKGVMFIIDGAKDSRNEGSCLFPEILKSELHGVRSVIEAYTRRAKLEGQEEASAAGIMKNSGEAWDVILRVTACGKVITYKLDRWD